MLVKLIMKVLKNLFGNNTKINASEVALRDIGGKAIELDNFLNKKILYENVNGTNQNFVLNDSCSNYRFVEIYGFCEVANHKQYIYQKAYNINNNSVNILSITQTEPTYILWSSAKLTFNDINVAISLNYTQTKTTDKDSNRIFVTRIIGYK